MYAVIKRSLHEFQAILLIHLLIFHASEYKDSRIFNSSQWHFETPKYCFHDLHCIAPVCLGFTISGTTYNGGLL